MSHGIQAKDTTTGGHSRGSHCPPRGQEVRPGAQQQTYEEPPPDEHEDQSQYTPPPADPADEIEHLAKLHESGALTDEEFASAKANVLGS